jgi:RNA polymerase sigma factor (TIGR02999 family)
MSDADEVARLLAAVRRGDDAALQPLFTIVYNELKTLAHSRRRHWVGDQTLDTTALVHEAYLKLVRADASAWQDRAHLLAIASTAMRQILVNYAERRLGEKRGGGAQHLSLDDVNPVAREASEELIALHESLIRLDAVDRRKRQVLEHRFFAGLSIEETAEVLQVSPATVKRDWALALAWLRRDLGDEHAPTHLRADG